jgi:GAF domain-containing protein
VLQGIADSLGTALDNDRLFKETRQNLEEIRVLNREYLQRTWSETINLHGELAYTFENPIALSQHAEGAMIEVPVSLRNEVIGYLSLETDHSVLSAEEQAFIENITNQTAIALENARLLEKTSQRADREKKVMEITARIRSSNDPERMMQIAADELQRALGASRAQIYVRRPEQNTAGNIPPEQSNGGTKTDGSNGHH